ncbi:hypothetical protein Hdeb2414_s0018g00524001 [Helianthus debilis subsp. tardiflorus]
MTVHRLGSGRAIKLVLEQRSPRTNQEGYHDQEVSDFDYRSNRKKGKEPGYDLLLKSACVFCCI